MAPFGRTKTTATTKSKETTETRIRTRYPRRTNFKNQQKHTKCKKQEMGTIFPSNMSSQDSSKEGDNEVCEVIDVTNSVCSTPKGHNFRIPEISTCPPAPKKPRLLSLNCSMRRSSLSFFSPPDLEHFFVALRNVSV
ncbi:hypothetical protein Lal_00021063 [Lupinus albus]|uniref:Uncharacterized protein n=1 Tax=Lupinus albus TaxID=3870 RepID=A0A6A5PDA7_LUPAL|nr:hypothetical protein Lalb_Chr15g0082551 [Lupinus albus]KAF1894769.1 hypothetical protein Lal_00021063 [Lupinus albus]